MRPFDKSPLTDRASPARTSQCDVVDNNVVGVASSLSHRYTFNWLVPDAARFEAIILPPIASIELNKYVPVVHVTHPIHQP